MVELKQTDLSHCHSPWHAATKRGELKAGLNSAHARATATTHSRRVACPRWGARIAASLFSASLEVFLAHWLGPFNCQLPSPSCVTTPFSRNACSREPVEFAEKPAACSNGLMSTARCGRPSDIAVRMMRLIPVLGSNGLDASRWTPLASFGPTVCFGVRHRRPCAVRQPAEREVYRVGEPAIRPDQRLGGDGEST